MKFNFGMNSDLFKRIFGMFDDDEEQDQDCIVDKSLLNNNVRICINKKWDWTAVEVESKEDFDKAVTDLIAYIRLFNFVELQRKAEVVARMCKDPYEDSLRSIKDRFYGEYAFLFKDGQNIYPCNTIIQGLEMAQNKDNLQIFDLSTPFYTDITCQVYEVLRNKNLNKE